MGALFGLAFASPPVHKTLGLPHILTRRLIKQKARHHGVIFTGGKNGYRLKVVSYREFRRFAPHLHLITLI